MDSRERRCSSQECPLNWWKMNRTIEFITLSGYQYPHSRVRCYNFAKELNKNGLKAKVLSLRDNYTPFLSEARMFGIPDVLKVLLTLISLLRLARFNRLFYIQKIHYHSAAPLLLARIGVPYVLDVDDWDENCCCLFNSTLLNKIFFGATTYIEIIENAARKAHFCVVSSHSLYGLITKWNDKVFLIETGVNVDRFKPAEKEPNPEKVSFCWPGVIWGELVYQSCAEMVESFACVYNSNKNVELHLAIAGQMANQFKDEVLNRWPELPVVFHSWLDPDDMPEFFRSCHVGLLPLCYSDDLWMNSKSPTKFFEYLASGLATVSSAVGELKYIVKEGENGFLAENKEEFSNKMLMLADDSSLRNKVGVSARKSAEANYDIKVLGEKLSNLLVEYVRS